MRTAGLPWLGEVEGTSVAMSQVKASPVPAHVPVVRVRYGAVDDEMRALYAGSLRGGSDEDDSTFEGSSAGLGRPQLMPDSYSIMPQGLTPARFHSRLHRYTSHPHLVEGHEAACPQAVAQGLRCASARDPQGETTKSAPHFGAATSVALYRI